VRGAGTIAGGSALPASWLRGAANAALLLSLLPCGCTFCQDIKDEYRYRFTKPDSEKILRESENGNERAWALSHLDEPLQHGGNQQKQDLYVKILTLTATADRDPLCRLTAIGTLGHYKDPRAVKALEDAYFSAKTFPDEEANALREQVLIALGHGGDASARELLIQVARADAREDTQQEKTQTLDLRLCALKSLGHFKQSDVTETLHRVMSTEKDVALRDRAYLSLEESTGLYLPPDPAKWDKLLHGTQTDREAVVKEAGSGFSLVGWWH
jgi:hypothetical protein